MTMQKRDSWFVNYPATRNLAERIRHFVQSDFRSASVLDVGCNAGQMSHQAIEWGARSVLGIDFDKEAVKLARQMAEETKINAEFSVEDADLPACWRSIPRVEVVLLLAIYLTKELTNKHAILANAAAKAGKVMYFEGHANETQGYRVQEYVRDIVQWTDFANVEYLGPTDAPGLRPLIRCWREPLTGAAAVDKIIEAMGKYRKVVVVGKSAVGKSFLFDQITRGGICMNHGVYDDVPPPYNCEPFILFDWRGLEYVPDAEAVFFVTCSETERQRRIDGQPYKDRLLRTAPGVATNARAVFTVRCE